MNKARQRGFVDGYSEMHHIVPRSLEGSDKNDNLVLLLAREHFIAHMLLTKMTSGSDQIKMAYAANIMMSAARQYQHRYMPVSKIHAMLREQFSKVHSDSQSGKKLTDEHKKKISEGLKGRKDSESTVQKRANSNRGKKRTEEQRKKMSEAQKSSKRTLWTDAQKEEYKNRISELRKGCKSYIRTEEHKKKTSESLKGKTKGVPKSEDTKNRMRKPKTEEHRRRISEGRKKLFAAKRDSSNLN